MRTSRCIAWAALVVGVLVSVWANVEHAADDALILRVMSGFAPVALLVAVELIVRIPWPAGAWWFLGRWVAVGGVAAVAAVTSYLHMTGLLVSYGEPVVTARIIPLSVDGLAAVGALALLALGRQVAPVPEVRPVPGPPMSPQSVRALGRVARQVPTVEPVPAFVPWQRERVLALAPHANGLGLSLAAAPPATNGRGPAASDDEVVAVVLAWRQDHGTDPTGAELGRGFMRSAAWGRDKIAVLRKRGKLPR